MMSPFWSNYCLELTQWDGWPSTRRLAQAEPERWRWSGRCREACPLMLSSKVPGGHDHCLV